jgi:hypothetical protein
VKWDAIRRFGVEHGIGVALPETKARGGQDSAYLDLILAQGDLAILGVNTDSDVSDADHFVLATRKTSVNGKPTYVINDPIFGVTTLLEQYGNQYYSILVLTQKVGQIDQRAISISVYQEGGSSAALDHTTTGISKFAPAEILVTDSLGRRSGYDPLTRTIWAEIPNTELLTLSIGSNGSSAPDGSRMGSKMMVISTPAEGEYKIDVTGVGAGSYTVTVNATDVQGSITRTVTRGVAYNGSSDSFNITYAAGSDNIPNGQMFIPSVLK